MIIESKIIHGRRGFTLIELSIVLVIIGLLIGGILVGQVMISSAKLQKAIRQLAQYDVAVSNFKTNYNQLPGDSNLFTISGFAGNNDGAIHYVANPTYTEMGLVWPQLSLGVGLKSAAGANYSAVSDNGVVTSNIAPSLDFPNQKTGVGTFNPHLQLYTISSATHYIYSISRMSTDYQYDPLKTVDALALDSKIDDGIANTGNVLAFMMGANTNNDCRGVDQNYDMANTDYSCSLWITAGSFNGMNY